MDMSVILWAHREFDLHGHALDVLDAALNAVKMSTVFNRQQTDDFAILCAHPAHVCWPEPDTLANFVLVTRHLIVLLQRNESASSRKHSRLLSRGLRAFRFARPVCRGLGDHLHVRS